MAKSRMINTKFWDDNYTSNLDPIEKLLFLYLLTNTSTNICGVYEIPVKKIAMETGIDKDMVLKILERFSKDSKVFYINGWIWLVNFIKNQNQRSPLVKKGIENELEAVPSHIKEKVIEKTKGIDTLSHLIKPNSTKSNLIKPNSSSEPKDSQIAEVIKLFEIVNPSIGKYYGNTTQRKACERLLKKWTVAQIKAVVDILPELNATPYVKGKSITPHQLEENLGFIKAFIDQKSNKKRKVAIIPNE